MEFVDAECSTEVFESTGTYSESKEVIFNIRKIKRINIWFLHFQSFLFNSISTIPYFLS